MSHDSKVQFDNYKMGPGSSSKWGYFTLLIQSPIYFSAIYRGYLTLLITGDGGPVLYPPKYFPNLGAFSKATRLQIHFHATDLTTSFWLGNGNFPPRGIDSIVAIWKNYCKWRIPCTKEYVLTFTGCWIIRIWSDHVGVFKNRGTPKWMVYNGKPY